MTPKHRFYRERPSKDAIRQMPVFTGLALGQIHLVHSLQDLARARTALAHAAELGFDTESKPTFVIGERRSGPHLIQLSTTDAAFLFPLAFEPNRSFLAQLLGDPSILKVAFDMGEDRRALAKHYAITVKNQLDLTSSVKALGYRDRVGMQAAVAIVLGQYLDKPKSASLSDWSAPKLTAEQMLYAGNDAFASLRVYQGLGAMTG